MRDRELRYDDHEQHDEHRDRTDGVDHLIARRLLFTVRWWITMPATA
jgi:hypothetical protein